MDPAKDVLGVAGAGLMGGEIALVQALAGFRVLLFDQTGEILQKSLARLSGVLDKGIGRGSFTAEVKAAALTRIEATTDIASFAGCSWVTEAVFEEQGVKQQVLRAIDEHCVPECVIATNTSTIPISTLASYVSAARQGRFIGTHYFSPVSRMKLVEVIAGFKTEPGTIDLAIEHMQRIQKCPVRVKDVAGFAVNRMLHVFVIEAVRLVEEGVATPEDIDKACRLGLGHAIGPFELMDVVTADLCLQAQEIMHDAYGERYRPPPLLKQRVRAGLGGGKGKPGWRS